MTTGTHPLQKRLPDEFRAANDYILYNAKNQHFIRNQLKLSLPTQMSRIMRSKLSAKILSSSCVRLAGPFR